MQHGQIVKLQQQVGYLNNGKPANSSAFVQPTQVRPARSRTMTMAAQPQSGVPMLSYGWGTL